MAEGLYWRTEPAGYPETQSVSFEGSQRVKGGFLLVVSRSSVGEYYMVVASIFVQEYVAVQKQNLSQEAICSAVAEVMEPP